MSMGTNTTLQFADTIFRDIWKIIETAFKDCTQKDMDRRKSNSFMRLFFLMVLKLKKMFLLICIRLLHIALALRTKHKTALT